MNHSPSELPSSNERVPAATIEALREMAWTIAVNGKLLLQLLDEIEAARRAAPEPPDELIRRLENISDYEADSAHDVICDAIKALRARASQPPKLNHGSVVNPDGAGAHSTGGNDEGNNAGSIPARPSRPHEPRPAPEAAKLQQERDHWKRQAEHWHAQANQYIEWYSAALNRASQPPSAALPALRQLAAWVWSYRGTLEKDVLDNDAEVIEARERMFAILDLPELGLRPPPPTEDCKQGWQDGASEATELPLSLADRAHGLLCEIVGAWNRGSIVTAEVRGAVRQWLVDVADRALQPPQSPQAEIAIVRIVDGRPVDIQMKSPGLPDGEHDLFCEPTDKCPPLPSAANQWKTFAQEIPVRDKYIWWSPDGYKATLNRAADFCDKDKGVWCYAVEPPGRPDPTKEADQ